MPENPPRRPLPPLAPLLALGILVATVFVINAHVRSNTHLTNNDLSTIHHVRLGSPPQWSLIGEGLHDPYRSRLFFRVLLVGTARLLHLEPEGFRVLFGVFNFLLSLATTAAIYLSGPRVFRLSVGGSFLAASLFVTSFVHLYAFEFPNYVIEDFLCYLLLILGLMAMAGGRWILWQVCVVCGVLSRETLLILTVVMWFRSEGRLTWKAAMSVPGGLAYLMPRLLVGGGLHYSLFLGWTHNTTYVATAVGFGFVTFGVLWVIGPIGWARCSALRDTPAAPLTSLVATALIFLTTLLFGRFLEARVMFLAFPWILIPAAMLLTTLDWSRVRWGVFAVLVSLVTLAAVIVYGRISEFADLPRQDWRTGWALVLPSLREFFRASGGPRLIHFSLCVYLAALWACLALSGGLGQRRGAGQRGVSQDGQSPPEPLCDSPQPPWIGMRVWATQAAALVLGVAALLVTSLPLRHLPLDDKFITATYARNLVEGHGWVFNIGELVNASTSTLNTLLGALVGLMGLPIPQALWWISLAAVAISMSVLLLGARLDTGEAGGTRRLIAGVFLATSAPLAATLGLETGLFILGLVLLCLAVDHGRWQWAFVVAGWLALVRGEGALVAALLPPLAWVWRRRLPWPEVLWLFVPTIPWAVFSWWQFGEIFPSSFEMKRLQGTSGLFGGDVIDLLTSTLFGLSPPWGWMILTLAALALLKVRSWPPSVVICSLFFSFTTALYSLWQVPAVSYFWYGVPLVFCLVWVAAEGAEGVVGSIRGRAALMVAAGIPIALVWLQGDEAQSLQSRYAPRAHQATLYAEAGAWVAEHTSPEATVAVTEIGQNGWHMRRHLIDLAGLVDPEIGRAIFGTGDMTGWLYATEPDWVLLRMPHDRIHRNLLLAEPGFARAYALDRVFESPGDAQRLEIYQRTGSPTDQRARAEMLTPDFDEEFEAVATEARLEADRLLDFQVSPEWTRFADSGRLDMRWLGSRGLELNVRGPDGFVWLPRISVPARAVRQMAMTMRLETPHRHRMGIVQVYWRGVDASGEVPGPDGLMEIPVPAGQERRIVFPVADHPDWRRIERLVRIRLDPGAPGTILVLRRIELLP